MKHSIQPVITSPPHTPSINSMSCSAPEPLAHSPPLNRTGQWDAPPNRQAQTPAALPQRDDLGELWGRRMAHRPQAAHRQLDELTAGLSSLACFGAHDLGPKWWHENLAKGCDEFFMKRPSPARRRTARRMAFKCLDSCAHITTHWQGYHDHLRPMLCAPEPAAQLTRSGPQGRP